MVGTPIDLTAHQFQDRVLYQFQKRFQLQGAFPRDQNPSGGGLFKVSFGIYFDSLKDFCGVEALNDS